MLVLFDSIRNSPVTFCRELFFFATLVNTYKKWPLPPEERERGTREGIEERERERERRVDEKGEP